MPAAPSTGSVDPEVPDDEKKLASSIPAPVEGAPEGTVAMVVASAPSGREAAVFVSSAGFAVATTGSAGKSLSFAISGAAFSASLVIQTIGVIEGATCAKNVSVGSTYTFMFAANSAQSLVGESGSLSTAPTAGAIKLIDFPLASVASEKLFASLSEGNGREDVSVAVRPLLVGSESVIVAAPGVSTATTSISLDLAGKTEGEFSGRSAIVLALVAGEFFKPNVTAMSFVLLMLMPIAY